MATDEQAGVAAGDVLTEVLARNRTTESAAGVLGVSLRQAQRLVARYRDGGGGALIHESRGHPASNRLSAGTRELVLELVRQSYRDFGPTLAAEVLLDRHSIEVSRETFAEFEVADKSEAHTSLFLRPKK
ncbi:helix-turn-helix domain-containing protein [Granulicella aggregans]|uniref:helix-turn-helix domain-containing protein n=1 Tax=Granulicella aggregans TaxID=474949 RepID=UPI0021E0E4BC|nr:helix-turn-helix domain-containing protein [Granulicella aggregans]